MPSRFCQAWVRGIMDFTLALCNILSIDIDRILRMHTKTRCMFCRYQKNKCTYLSVQKIKKNTKNKKQIKYFSLKSHILLKVIFYSFFTKVYRISLIIFSRLLYEKKCFTRRQNKINQSFTFVVIQEVRNTLFK